MQTIDRQIEAAQQQGNRAVEAMLRGQKAAGYTLHSNWQLAAAELEKAAALAETAGRPYNQAQALLALGKVLAHMPGETARQITTLQMAARLFREAGQDNAAVPALQSLAQAFLSQSQFDDALATIDEAIALAQTEADGAKIVALHQLQASAGLMQLDWELMEFGLQQALAAAHQHGVPELATAIKGQLNSLAILSDGQLDPLALAELQAFVAGGGPADSPAPALLARAGTALQLGQHAQAHELAEEALLTARQSQETERYLHYLLASLIQAGSAVQQEDRPGVLAALLRCRAFLTHHLGNSVGGAIDRILDELGKGWGPAGMAEAIAAYQARIDRDGKIQA
ncbi:MAG: hypothetical protein KDE28_21875 [Anaerolineales bacterium]|nr:hypothetical protein [Anaerolineales bacterium]